MPYSYSKFKQEVKEHILANFPRETRFLDVGAGSGVYADLLRQHYDAFDGIEIHEKYSEMFNLRNKYRYLFIDDIRYFDFTEYDYLIMGDVIEHLTAEDAKMLLGNIQAYNKKCMVAVPFLFEQGEEYGNVHETHLQPDLTHEIFLSRYPQMNLLYKDENYGYYVNY